MTTTAQFWQKQFVDDSNNPFDGVQIYHYEAGTTTDLDVYVDYNKSTVAPQPVTGDSRGVVSFYGDGIYRIRVVDKNNILLYDWDSVEIAVNPISFDSGDTPSTGDIIRWIGPGTLCEWDKLDLTTDVTGILPPANGGTGQSDTPVDGELLIGSTADGVFKLNTLTAGSGISISNGDGSITISTSAAGTADSSTFSSVGQNSTVGTNCVTIMLRADGVVMKDNTGGQYSVWNPADIEVAINIAGPIINGRDQLAAFSNSSWVHFYWIHDGTTLAGISSATAPNMGSPTMPTGYTYWAYAGAARIDTSGNLIKVYIQTDTAYYAEWQIALQDLTCNTGGTIAETALDISDFIPPNASGVIAWALLSQTNFPYDTEPRATIGVDTGLTYSLISSGEDPEGDSQVFTAPNVGQQLYYSIDCTNGTNKDLNIRILGYKLPNGGA